MVLRPGRMKGIAAATADDLSVFPCHQHTRGETNDETGQYQHNGEEQACLGALAYGLKNHGQIPVLARMAIRDRQINIHLIASHFDAIEDPGRWKTDA